MKRKQPRAARAPEAPAPAPAAAAPRPTALGPELRRSIQLLLARIEQTTPALRQAGAFEILGLIVQAGHALKHVAEHSHALELALGLEPPAPAGPPAQPNGAKPNGVAS